MDLKELAKALGLPEDATQEEVNVKMLAMLKEMMESRKKAQEEQKTAETQTAALSAGLAEHGLKLSSGKVVKDVVAGGAPRSSDDAEKAELRAAVAKNPSVSSTSSSPRSSLKRRKSMRQPGPSTPSSWHSAKVHTSATMRGSSQPSAR